MADAGGQRRRLGSGPGRRRLERAGQGRRRRRPLEGVTFTRGPPGKGGIGWDEQGERISGSAIASQATRKRPAAVLWFMLRLRAYATIDPGLSTESSASNRLPSQYCEGTPAPCSEIASEDCRDVPSCRVDPCSAGHLSVR
ncbi:hypothetical protein [Sorangium sp. So ce176]|uniref:hypothetical protein n=1 Tax=Sorangium sp. So ce176 TaxID=3133286 RepID=UPI003F643CFB